MPPVGPQGEGGVPQDAQVTYLLPINRPAKLGLLQDGFLQLGVSDLAVRHGCGGAERQKRAGEENRCRFHDRPIYCERSDWAASLARARCTAVANAASVADLSGLFEAGSACNGLNLIRRVGGGGVEGASGRSGSDLTGLDVPACPKQRGTQFRLRERLANCFKR
jgi:hypothetical protein